MHCTHQARLAAVQKCLQLIHFYRPRCRVLVGFVKQTTWYSLLPILFPSKCKQNFSSEIISFSRFFTCSAFLITRRQTPDCDGVGTSTPSSAKLWRTPDAFLVDKDCLDTSLAATFVDWYLRFFEYSSWTISGSDSLLLLFPFSPLLDSHATAWLVEGEDWRLGRFEGCIVDIGATFSVVYPVRPPDSICLLYSSLSSTQSQFPLLFVMSNSWWSFSANCSLFRFLYFSKDFINLSTFADTCCFERNGNIHLLPQLQ